MKPTDSKIVVAVRKRPLTAAERRRSETDVVRTAPTSVVLLEPKEKLDLTPFTLEHKFTFDQVYGETSSTEDIFRAEAGQLARLAVEGGKTTCFAYGQTGSGKTFTMFGERDIKGLVQLAVEDVYKAKTRDSLVSASFYEIYCGKIFDIVNGKKPIFLREDGDGLIQTVGLTEVPVSSAAEMIQLIAHASKSRVTSSTSGNYDSSRSHAVIQLKIRTRTGEGRLSFIDLAGNEKAAATSDSDKQTRVDGAEINKSLLALKECFRAMDSDQRHTPYRGSKLTMVLRDSFEGNSRTLMIACVSPIRSCSEQTLNTLRYADRVKELPGAAKEERKLTNGKPPPKGPPTQSESKPPLKRSVSTTITKKFALTTSREVQHLPSQKGLLKLPTAEAPPVEVRNPSKVSMQISAKTKEPGRIRTTALSQEPDSVSTLFKRPLRPIRPPDHTDLTARDSVAEEFPIFRFLFKKPLAHCSPGELKDLHYDIITHMISTEEGLLDQHRHHVTRARSTLQDEIAMVSLQENKTPNHFKDLYCKRMFGLLDSQLSELATLKAEVARFSSYLREERDFAEKFIRNLDPRSDSES